MGRMNLGSHILNSFGITAIDKRIKKISYMMQNRLFPKMDQLEGIDNMRHIILFIE